jgi:hypothetical protein
MPKTPLAAKGSPWKTRAAVGSVGMTLTAEAANARTASLQLKDFAGKDLAIRGGITFFLSDDANGDSVAAAAPSGGVAAGADGITVPLVAGKVFLLLSEADGDIDIVITEAAAKTFYACAVLDGVVTVIGAIAFV